MVQIRSANSTIVPRKIRFSPLLLHLYPHPHPATQLTPNYNANARAAKPTAATAGPKLAAMPVLDATGLPLPEPVAVEPAVMVAVPVPDPIDPVAVALPDIAVAGSAGMAPYAEQSALGAVGQLDCGSGQLWGFWVKISSRIVAYLDTDSLQRVSLGWDDRGGWCAFISEERVKSHADGCDVCVGDAEGCGGEADLLDEVAELEGSEAHVLVGFVHAFVAGVGGVGGAVADHAAAEQDAKVGV